MGSQGGAQLSNRLLVPPDGLTFKAGTAGEFFGIAWMALPLTQAKTGTTPVGNQNWTLFANATNFQGPVMFYIPDIWEVMAQSYPVVAGRGLDVRPAISKSLVMGNELHALLHGQRQDGRGLRANDTAKLSDR